MKKAPYGATSWRLPLNSELPSGSGHNRPRKKSAKNRRPPIISRASPRTHRTISFCFAPMEMQRMPSRTKMPLNIAIP